MFKLLIIEDTSKGERPLSRMLLWEKYGLCLCGCAGDGREGLEKIRRWKPDLVITETRMPGMNGAEMIQESRKAQPGILFIVIGQYEDYDYVSRLMECGVKYYLLTPCKKERLEEAVRKAVRELREEKGRKGEETFLLLAKEERGGGYIFLSPRMEERRKIHRLILCATEEGMRIYGQYADCRGEEKESLLEEGERLPFAVEDENSLFQAVRRLLETAGSRERTILSFHVFDYEAEARLLTEWPPLPFPAALVQRPEPLRDAFFYLKDKQERGVKISYFHLKKTDDYRGLFFSLNLLFCKFAVKKCTKQELLRLCAVLTGTLYHKGAEEFYARLPENARSEDIYRAVQEIVAEESLFALSFEELRMADILKAVYQNFHREELSALWLCKNVLHLNEDYFGRVFLTGMNDRFSNFVMKIRIDTAARLIESFPETSLNEIARIVGYSADGQQFSRAFRRRMGMSPSQFKNERMK